MTNNPTIDGVSRGLIEMTIDLLQDLRRGTAVERKLRALLDAPAVERQEPSANKYRGGSVGVPRDLLEAMCSYEWHGELASSNAQQLRGILDGRITGWESSEIAAPQSTIARLEARIAELESGRGEPVAWLDLEKVSNGMAYATNAKINERQSALFTAPPAPVAVVIDEQQAFANWTHEVIGMRGLAKVQRRDEMTVEQEKFALKGWLARACLDATAALNVVADGKARDV